MRNRHAPIKAFGTFADIKANDWDLSINRYKEVVYEEVHTKPATIEDIKRFKKKTRRNY
jgi:type I restriction enzyme M protein